MIFNRVPVGAPCMIKVGEGSSCKFDRDPLETQSHKDSIVQVYDKNVLVRDVRIGTCQFVLKVRLEANKGGHYQGTLMIDAAQLFCDGFSGAVAQGLLVGVCSQVIPVHSYDCMCTCAVLAALCTRATQHMAALPVTGFPAQHRSTLQASCFCLHRKRS